MLNERTVTDLQTMSKSVIKSPTKGPKFPSIPKIKVANTAEPPISHLKRKENGSSSKKAIYYCKEHIEEEITYYCFNCWVNICPECAIHGTDAAMQEHTKTMKLSLQRERFWMWRVSSWKSSAKLEDFIIPSPNTKMHICVWSNKPTKSTCVRKFSFRVSSTWCEML